MKKPNINLIYILGKDIYLLICSYLLELQGYYINSKQELINIQNYAKTCKENINCYNCFSSLSKINILLEKMKKEKKLKLNEIHKLFYNSRHYTIMPIILSEYDTMIDPQIRSN
jgi:hypothetical protein